MKESTPKCTRCSRAIQGDDVNVAKDIAYCRACNVAHKLSALIQALELTEGVDVNSPPPGVLCNVHGGRLAVSATHRSLGASLGTLAFTLFWNGMLSIFILFALSATLHNLHMPVPEWFPSPDMNGSQMSPGMTTFMWIFLTPFIVIGTAMAGMFLLTVGGRTEVQADQKEGTVFTGIGPLGYRQRFLPATVSDVHIDDKQWRDSDGDHQRKTYIVIETNDGRLIRFGTMLSEERRRFVAALLRKALTACRAGL